VKLASPSRCTVVALLLLAGAAFRPAPLAFDESAADDRFEKLSAFVAAKAKEHQVPGVVVGVLADGTISARGFGITNADHPLPVTETTLFQVGSITKTFTGTLLMRLAEAGNVDLDAPVRRYIPEFRVRDEAAGRDATVLDLLTHMGGWEGDVFEDTGWGDDATAKYVRLLADVEQVAPLRQVWSYNNAGFTVAGRIIEIATGRSYEDALDDLLIKPLALESTFIWPGDVMTRRFAVGHSVSEKGVTVLRPWPIGRYAHAMGGIVATVPDILRYARFHLGLGPEGVLSRAALQRMHAPQFAKQATDGDEMAITWHLSRVGGLRQVGHNGATVGQQALLNMYPERGLAVALVTNGGRGARLAQDTSREALRLYATAIDRDPEPLASQPDVTPYVGRYSRPYADVVVENDGGRLTVQSIQKRGFPNAKAPVPPPGPKLPVSFYAPDRLIVTNGAQQGGRIQIVRNSDGSIGWIRMGSRIHRKVP
jgi:CubicO group peptidase (beta-lactamase class C family)